MFTKEAIMYAWEHLYKTFLLGFVFSQVFAIWFIPFLKQLKFRQEIREEGPKNHQKKAGTPTMGGILFLAAFFLVVSVSLKQFLPEVNFILVTTAGFAIIGFIDDYIKVIKRKNLGLRAYQKFSLQLIFSIFLAFWAGKVFGLTTYIPFMAKPIYLGYWYYILMVFTALGTVNGANLTDGLDGLATGVAAVIILTLSLIAKGATQLAASQGIYFMGMAMVGALIGFLQSNRHPAKVFMGDTGSLCLGGIIWAISAALHLQVFLIIFAATFVIEALSVIIQVVSYKLRKKRVFKMAPIHHHFELSGFDEVPVVYGFYLFTVFVCYIGYMITKIIIWIPFVD